MYLCVVISPSILLRTRYCLSEETNVNDVSCRGLAILISVSLSMSGLSVLTAALVGSYWKDAYPVHQFWVLSFDSQLLAKEL